MRIALLATVVDFGGSERVVLTQLEHFHREAFEIVPILYSKRQKDNNKFLRQMERMKIKYRRIITDECNYRWLNPIVNLITTYRMLRNSRFDIIHSHGYRADVIGVLCSRMTGLPLVSTCHGFIPQTTRLRIYNRLDKIVLKYCSRIFAVSDSIREELIDNEIKSERIVVIRNAVNPPADTNTTISIRRLEKRLALGIDDERIIIGYAGRLSEEKGIKYLLSACARLVKEGLPVNVLLVGDGTQKNELEHLCTELGISDGVVFAGFQDDIEEWIPCMDVFVLPSLTEGTPMSLLEAMACEVPVIATAVGGIPQIIETGVNGILISPGKVEEIAVAVRTLYDNEILRKRCVKEAKKTIKERYGITNWIDKIEAEYLALVN